MDEVDEEQGGDAVEASVLRKTRWVDALTSVSLGLFRWGGLVLIARYAYLAIATLAGKTTVADLGFGIQMFASVKLSQILAWVFGVGGVGYGLLQRQLRRRTIDRLQSRIIGAETMIDPNRTTSRLTSRGDTNPEDR